MRVVGLVLAVAFLGAVSCYEDEFSQGASLLCAVWREAAGEAGALGAEGC